MIDSVPLTVIQEDDQSVPMNDIHTYRRITDKDSINNVFKVIGPDTLIFILTKLYMQKPDSLRRIPSLSALKFRGNKYYRANDTTAYTGSFIETYLNGAKRFAGTIENGKISGYASLFYPDGTLKFSGYYRNNQQDGVLEEYFPNGALKRRGEMSGGKMNGLWREWYSSGNLKEVQQFIMGNTLYTTGTGDFYIAFDKAKTYIENKRYADALGELNYCLRIDKNLDYVYMTQGTVFYLQNKFAKAIAAYTKAIELEPLESSFYISRATATMRLIEENKESLGKLKNLNALKKSICDDYRKATELGERTIPEGSEMRRYCE